MTSREDGLERYCAAFVALTPETLDELGALVSDDVRFRDPFNDIRGRDRFLAVFKDMFEETVNPRFQVLDRAVGEKCAFIRWDMTFERAGKPWRFEGVSEIWINDDGLVTAHLDHWDSGAQLYAKIPLLGWVINKLRAKLAV